MVLQIVLAGAGLCNIQVAKLLHDMLSSYSEDVQVTLVSAWEYTYYSAMYPGVLAEQYDEAETRIHLLPLAVACRTRLIIDTVVGISAASKTISLASGSQLPFDILAVNVGSRTHGTGSKPGLVQHAILTRPLNVFLAKLQHCEEQLLTEGVAPRVIIVGSGPSGLELSLVLRRRLNAKFPGGGATITIVDEQPKVLPNSSVSYRALVLRNLKEKHIKVFANARVSEVRRDEAELEDGRILKADIFIWATGCEPQSIQHDLSVCRQGFILVNRSMQTLTSPEIFGAGDCVTIQGFPQGFPPKTGVHAVREGPVVAANMAALVKYRLLRIPLSFMLFEPQSDLLTLLNLGDGRGIVTKYGMTFSGEWVFRLKDFVNKRFIHRYSPLALLGPAAYQHLQTLGYDESVQKAAYAMRVCDTTEDYSIINWYDASRRSQDIQSEVNELEPDIAFDLLLESSDTLKVGSSDEFEFQLSILQRTDRDTEFRYALLRRYEEATSELNS
jgi:selenide,water dikinase